MKNKLSFISVEIKASTSYIIAALLSKGLNIITLPVFTRILTTTDMGIVSTFTSWYNILYAVVTLSLTSASFNVAMMEYPDKRDKYQSTCLQISFVSALIFAVIYTLFYRFINKVTTLTLPLFILQIVLFLVNPALDSWYARQRYEYKYKSVFYVSAGVSIVSILIALFAIALAKKNNIKSLGTVRIISQNGIIILVGLFFCFRILYNGKLGIDRLMAVFSLKLSIPLIIHSLAKNILDTSDRLMIAKLCGNSAAGIYGTIYTISLFALIIWNSMNSAIIPTLFNYMKDNNIHSIRKLSNFVLLFFSGITIVTALLSPEILALFTTKEYLSAVYLMPAIIGGVFMTALYGLYGNFLIYAKKTELVMSSTISVAVLNFILNFIFIRKYGYMAAAYTTLICFTVLACLQGIMQYVVYRKEIISSKFAVCIAILTIIICLFCNLLY